MHLQFTATFCALIWIAGILAIAAEHAVQEEKGILVLNEENFKKVVSNFTYLVVEFYAPWCEACKIFASEYEKAAILLKDNGILEARLAKIDATNYTDIAKSYEVDSYPTFKFFANGTISEYKGGMKAQSIYQWLAKKSLGSVTEINSATDLAKFLANNDVAVIGKFQNTNSESKLEAFRAAANDTHFAFGLLLDKEASEQLNLIGDLTEVLLKKSEVIKGVKFVDTYRFSESNLNWTQDSISRWVAFKSLPTVVEFNDQAAEAIFNGLTKSHTILFDSKKRSGYSKLRAAFNKAARKLKSNTTFVFLDTDVKNFKSVMDFFGIRTDKLPVITCVILGEKSNVKYKIPQIDDSFNETSIANFVHSVFANETKPYWLTQDLPADWDAKPVKQLVVSNYDAITQDESKHVYVEFYSPVCPHCKSLGPTWEQLGELFSHREDMVFAKIDGTKNELENLPIPGYPTILWYPKGSKLPFQYLGDRSVDSLMQFIESKGEKIIEHYAGERDAEDDGQDEFGFKILKAGNSSSTSGPI